MLVILPSDTWTGQYKESLAVSKPLGLAQPLAYFLREENAVHQGRMSWRHSEAQALRSAAELARHWMLQCILPHSLWELRL